MRTLIASKRAETSLYTSILLLDCVPVFFSPIEKHLIIWLINNSDASNIHPVLFEINNFYYFILGCILNKINYSNEYNDSYSILANQATINDLKLLFEKYKINYGVSDNNEIYIFAKK